MDKTLQERFMITGIFTFQSSKHAVFRRPDRQQKLFTGQMRYGRTPFYLHEKGL